MVKFGWDKLKRFLAQANSWSGTQTFANVVITGSATIPTVLEGYTTTATAAGSTTLTVSSTYHQFFTGTTTQTVVMPVTSTLSLGHDFRIVNKSTGVVTVNSSGGNAIVAMVANSECILTCIAITGTGAASWDIEYSGISGVTGTGNMVLATSPALTTPNIGTPSAGTLTSCTGLPAAGVVGTAAVIADTIKGDGTAGRSIRSTRILIENGTEAAHIKVTSTSFFNGDTNAVQDNIGKDAVDTGVWNLDATGAELKLLDAGISGTLVQVLSASIWANYSGTAINVAPGNSSNNLLLSFSNAATGAAVDISTLVDTNLFYILVCYVTTA